MTFSTISSDTTTSLLNQCEECPPFQWVGDCFLFLFFVMRLTSAMQGLVVFACGNALIWMFFFVCASLQCCLPGWILWCRHLCKYSLMRMLSLCITRVILFTSLLHSLTLFCLFTIPHLSKRIEKNISHIGSPFCSLHFSLFHRAELTVQSSTEWILKKWQKVGVHHPSKLKFKKSFVKIKNKMKHLEKFKANWMALGPKFWKFWLLRISPYSGT